MLGDWPKEWFDLSVYWPKIVGSINYEKYWGFFWAGEKTCCENDDAKYGKLAGLICPVLLQEYRCQVNWRKYMDLSRARKGNF